MAAARAAPAREADTEMPRHPGALLARRDGMDAKVRWLDARDVRLRSMIGNGKDPGTVLTSYFMTCLISALGQQQYNNFAVLNLNLQKTTKFLNHNHLFQLNN